MGALVLKLYENGLYEGFVAGEEKVHIPLVQYADDTFLFCKYDQKPNGSVAAHWDHSTLSWPIIFRRLLKEEISAIVSPPFAKEGGRIYGQKELVSKTIQ